MNLNVHGLMKWVKTLADNASLGLKFYPPDGKHRAPATDGKYIYVDHPELTWDNQKITEWQAGIYHEIGHNVPAMMDIFDKLQKENIDMRALYGNMINLVDDHRQEHYKYDEFLHKRRIMNDAQGTLTDKIVSSISEALKKDPKLYTKREGACAIFAMLIGDANARKSWQSSASKSLSDLEHIAPPEVRKFSDQLKQPKWCRRFEELETADDVFELVDDLMREVFKMNPEEEKKKSQKPQKGEGGEQNKKGSGKKSMEEAQAELGNKRGTPTDAELMDAMNKDRHLTTAEKGELGSGSGRSGQYSGTGEFVPLDQRDIKIVSGKEIDHSYGTGSRIPWEPVSNLAKSVRRVLLSEKQTKRLHGQKRGEIDPKNIHRVTLKEARGYNERIFRTKASQYDVDVAVSILQDCSGSMSGSKYHLASNASISLGEALNLINVPYQVNGFTDGHEVRIWQFKDFNEKFNKEKMQNRFQIVYSHMGNNDDPDCVLWAYNQLIQRPESRKLLIVLSDGSPYSSSNPTKIYEGLEQICHAIHKDSPVEIHGIGMQYDAVSKYYPSYEVINDMNELEPALLKLIHRKIIKQK